MKTVDHRTIPRPWSGIALIAVLMLAVGIGLIAYYQSQVREFSDEARSEIAAVATLKAADIADWRATTATFAETFRGNAAFASLVGRVMATGSGESDLVELEGWFQGLRLDPSVDGAYILAVDHPGLTVFGPKDRVSDLCPIEDVLQGDESDEIVFQELRRADPQSEVYLSVSVPIDVGGGPSYVLCLTLDPEGYLYPYLQEWPVPSDTAETLLVRRDADDVLFLNDLRFKDDAALDFRLPMTQTDLPAVMAAQGREGLLEGLDYRGIEVIASVAAIPDSPWFLVAKMDAAEAYARVTDHLFLVVGALGLIFVIGVGSAIALWRRQQLGHYMSLYQAVRAGEERFRLIAENAPGAVYVCHRDLPWRMVYVNPGMESLTGVSARVFLDHEVGYADICHPDDVPRMQEEVDRAVKQGESFHLVYRVRRPDGVIRWVEEFGAALDTDGTNLLEGLIFDITERRASEKELEDHRQHLAQLVDERTRELAATNRELDKANEDLRSGNERLREATQAKSRFLANMSHELRTPLNSIIGFSGAIQQGLAGPLTDEQSTQMRMINASGRHLLGLIDDVLDLAKTEAGKTEVSLEEFVLDDVAREVIDIMTPLAAEKHVTLEYHGPIVSCDMMSDPAKIRQVLLNLVSNAVKYTGRGAVAITVECRPGRDAQVVVADTGPGISSEDSEHIFEAFVQVNSADSAKPKGTGLGLALSLKYARMLKGDLRLDNPGGPGATFVLEIPDQSFG